MPPILALLPVFAEIATIAGAGTSIGLGIANSGGSSMPNGPSTPSGPTPPANQTNPSQIQSLLQQVPSIQQNLGGAVSPDYYMQMIQLLSGQANNPGSGNAALQAWAQSQGQGSSGGLTTQPVIGSGGP